MAEYQHSIKGCRHNEAIVSALCAVWQAGRIYQAAAMFADTVSERVAVYDKLMQEDGMSMYCAAGITSSSPCGRWARPTAWHGAARSR